MITNLLVVAFVLAMAYWMSLQGFFSAFLHLIVVLVAGSLALALWEPLVYSFGMNMQPHYAWGLWLLGPFVLLLIVLRLALDRVVRANVNFQNLISTILGGACGVAAGILTAGITIIGLGFLPLPQSLAGIDPWVVSGGGQVEKQGPSLWIPVDEMASSVFSGLSQRGFATSTPLARYQPDLARQASQFRMGKGYDEHASIVAIPGTVEATGYYSQPAPVEQLDAAVGLQLGAPFQNQANKLVVVDTEWTSDQPGTFDVDNSVRIPPTQIRLIARPTGPGASGEMVFHSPVGFSHAQGDNRVFHAFDAAGVVAFGDRQSETFAWAFLIPAEHEPQYLLARHLRVPNPTREPEAIAQAIGQPAPTAEQAEQAGANGRTAGGGSEVGGREGRRAGNVARSIEISKRLPGRISKNFVQGLRTSGTGIMEGKATASKAPGSISQNTVIDSVYVADHRMPVRLRIEQDRAQSLLGQATVAAASLQGVWLTDERGDRYQPIAYVWAKASGEQEIAVDRNNPIRSARQLPVSQMGRGDELFLYFSVPGSARIVSYNIGDTTRQEIDPPLTAN